MAESRGATDGRDHHDRHDPERIAALLDRDLPEADRAFAQARVDTCEDCAALHADLMALMSASVELPTPVRPRDFTLTLAQAAVLVVEPAGEPVGAGARLTGDMTDAGARHAAHDRLLIASLVDRSVPNSERILAEAQLASCRECALLFDDLAALSLATRALPVPSRSRDFALTPADAERLRGGAWRRFLAAIGSSRDVFSRPLAIGLTTLGLAGLLVATVPGALTGQAGSTAALSAAESVAGDASGGAEPNPDTRLSEPSAASPAAAVPGAAAALLPAAAATGAPAPAPVASAESDSQSLGADNFLVAGDQSPPADKAGEAPVLSPYAADLPDSEPTGGPTLITVAGLLLLAGLGLFGLRWMGRRTGDR